MALSSFRYHTALSDSISKKIECLDAYSDGLAAEDSIYGLMLLTVIIRNPTKLLYQP